jgi:hypothetical protein
MYFFIPAIIPMHGLLMHRNAFYNRKFESFATKINTFHLYLFFCAGLTTEYKSTYYLLKQKITLVFICLMQQDSHSNYTDPNSPQISVLLLGAVSRFFPQSTSPGPNYTV